MKISPLDIRQKQFTKKTFGGYDKEEVTAFLIALSGSWEKLLDENRDLRIKLESAEKDANKLRDLQDTLLKTLKTAEETSKALLDSAQKDAESELANAKGKSDALLNDAKWKAKSLLEEAEEEARKVYKNLESEVQKLEQNFKQIESLRNKYLEEVKSLSGEIVDKVERVALKTPQVVFIAPSPTIELLSTSIEEKKPEDPAILSSTFEPTTEATSIESLEDNLSSPTNNEPEKEPIIVRPKGRTRSLEPLMSSEEDEPKVELSQSFTPSFTTVEESESLSDSSDSSSSSDKEEAYVLEKVETKASNVFIWEKPESSAPEEVRPEPKEKEKRNEEGSFFDML